MVYGRTSTSGGRVQKRVSYSDWVVSIGEHRGVISGMEWVSVQSILHCNSYKSKSIHNVNSLLSGMVYCPVCNSKMISRTKKFGFVYACSNKLSHGTKACKSPNIDSSLDDILLNSLFNTPPSDSVIPKLQALKQHIARGGEGTINLNANANPKHILLEGFKAMPIKLQREYIGKLLSSVKLTM
jgi:site-specific DNA recombinase